uniref:Uncharacterized protein n=1 Tax=Rhizophora mucronata TaxID=61149 RepID=A0A2P2NEX4_RHIMU
MDLETQMADRLTKALIGF